MSWITTILTILFAIAALIGVGYVVASIYGWERVWERMAGPADLGAVEFEGLSKTRKPNQALVCPDSLCKDSDRDFAAPVYALSTESLRQEVLKSLESEKDLQRVDDGNDPLRLRFVQRTPRLRFPDTINVQILQVNAETSTLALYSRSQIGESDFGVNLARIKRWLRRLQAFEKK